MGFCDAAPLQGTNSCPGWADTKAAVKRKHGAMLTTIYSVCPQAVLDKRPQPQCTVHAFCPSAESRECEIDEYPFNRP